MAQYNWDSCPTPVRTQIQTFCQQVHASLKDDLVGIYLHGSLAMGCFNPERSDVDVLVVTTRQMSLELKRQIITHLLALSNQPCSIETSFLILAELSPSEHPLLYDLHYSESWREQYTKELTDGTWQHWNDERRRDPDLTAHFMIARHRGVTLYGKPIEEVFPLVSSEDYISSILGDYRDAREGRTTNPMYFVLNACRVVAYLSEGHVYSKDEGGMYGLETFPIPYHGLIRQSLDLYRGRGQALLFDEKVLDIFAEFVNWRVFSHQTDIM